MTTTTPNIDNAAADHHYEIVVDGTNPDGTQKIVLDYWSNENTTRVRAPALVTATTDIGYLFIGSQLSTAYGLRLDLSGDHNLATDFGRKTGLACDQDLKFSDTGGFTLKLTTRTGTCTVKSLSHGSLTQGPTALTPPCEIPTNTEVIFTGQEGAELTIARTEVPILVEKIFNDPKLETQGYAYLCFGGDEFTNATEIGVYAPATVDGEVSVPMVIVDIATKTPIIDDPTFTVKKGRSG